MTQTWHDLLFVHWPVAPEALRSWLPEGLELDLYEGQAWVSLVPFGMSDVRFKGIVGMPTATHFPELNLRTYVKAGEGKPGVWFFSLDAGSRLAVFGGRTFFHLPYYNAHMRLKVKEEYVVFSSERIDGRGLPARFSARYGPDGNLLYVRPGSLNGWLVERYCLYTTDRKGRVLRGDIAHAPWSIQPAWAEISTNDLALAAGLDLPSSTPLLHFARRQEMRAWPLWRI